MLARLFGLRPGRAAVETPAPVEPPAEVAVEGLAPFALASHLSFDDGFARLDWSAVDAWLAPTTDPSTRDAAWTACERAWLEHLRAALGPGYALRENATAIVVSSLEPNVAAATLDFMSRTLSRIVRVLDGVAVAPPLGKDILIVFDDLDTYYRYVAHGDDGGESGFSSGTFLNGACGHFVTTKGDLATVEPVIAHEMTHACLSHLTLPLWLNEGLAVNTEQTLCPPPPSRLGTPAQLHRRQVRFWDADRIDGFWAGATFSSSDEAQALSYDLARVLVAQLGKAWPAFTAFVNAADPGDAGAAAAAEHLGIDLGAIVCVLLEREPDPAWSPLAKARAQAASEAA